MKSLYNGIGHVAVYTKNMDESIAFYEKIGGSLHKQDSAMTPNGEKKLALVEFGGFIVELIQPPVDFPEVEGVIPHFAVYVKDLDAIAKKIQDAGVDTFLEKEKSVLPHIFGGLQNWFFKGPSGEVIELLQML